SSECSQQGNSYRASWPPAGGITMSIISRGMTGLVAALAVLAFSAGGAQADSGVDFTNPAFARTIGPTSIPIGHMDFCRRHGDECGAYASVSDAAALTQPRWEQLVSINNRMNTEIVPVTDSEF